MILLETALSLKPLNCRLCLEKTQVISEKLLDFLSYVSLHVLFIWLGNKHY